jgi:hypothetical protein
MKRLIGFLLFVLGVVLIGDSLTIAYISFMSGDVLFHIVQEVIECLSGGVFLLMGAVMMHKGED